MASEYTTHRRYPLYTDQDKPNLRDQYNGAVRMIDGDMDDALDAAGHVSDALGAGFDAQHTVRMALDDVNAKFGSGISSSNTVTDQLNDKANETALSDEATARQNADTALSNRLGSGVTEQNTATAQLASKATITQLNDAVAPLATQASVNAMSGRVDDAQLHGKVVILIGDSYGEGYTPDGNVDGWCKRAHDMLAQSGITVKYASLGGASLGNGNLLNRLQSVVSGMTDSEKKRCSKVIIGGCYNDRSSSQASVTTGAKNIANYIRDNLPNARGILTTIGRCVTGLTSGAHAGTSMNQVRLAANMWRDGGCDNGLTIDLAGLSVLKTNNLFSSDYVHPNSAGLTMIARHIVNLINGVTNNNYEGWVVINAGALSGANGWNVTADKQILASTNEYGFATSFYFGTTGSQMIELNRETATSILMGMAGYHIVGTIHQSIFCGTNTIVPAQFVLHTSNGDYYEASGMMGIDDAGNLFISPADINDAKSNYRTLNVDRIQIRSLSLNFG